MGLCLSRKKGQKVYVGDDVVVEVVKVDRGKVVLRFTAPPSVKIFRDDVGRSAGGRAELDAARAAAERREG